MFDGNFKTIGRATSITQPYRSKEAVATSLRSEEEHNLGNWSYDGMRQMTSYYSITQFYNPTLATYEDIQTVE